MRRFALPAFYVAVGFALCWIVVRPGTERAPSPPAHRPEFGGIAFIRVDWSDPSDSGKREARKLAVYRIFPHEATLPPRREVRAGDWVISLHTDETGESNPVATYLAGPVP